jgi:hypothetical protein
VKVLQEIVGEKFSNHAVYPRDLNSKDINFRDTKFGI